MDKEVMIYIKKEDPVNVKRLIMVLLDLGYGVWKKEGHICFQLGGDDSVIPPEDDKMFEVLQEKTCETCKYAKYDDSKDIIICKNENIKHKFVGLKFGCSLWEIDD